MLGKWKLIVFVVFLFKQFKHVPLYLEWAPLEVFSGKPEDKNCKETKRDQNISEDRVSFLFPFLYC